jgi:hypothetical protein
MRADQRAVDMSKQRGKRLNASVRRSIEEFVQGNLLAPNLPTVAIQRSSPESEFGTTNLDSFDDHSDDESASNFIKNLNIRHNR